MCSCSIGMIDSQLAKRYVSVQGIYTHSFFFAFIILGLTVYSQVIAGKKRKKKKGGKKNSYVSSQEQPLRGFTLPHTPTHDSARGSTSHCSEKKQGGDVRVKLQGQVSTRILIQSHSSSSCHLPHRLRQGSSRPKSCTWHT